MVLGVLALRIDESMSKAEVIRRAQALADKFEVIEKRRVAQIDRLIGHAYGDDKINPKIPPYEHELMQLNEQLGMQDIRLELLEGVLRRIRQSARDSPTQTVMAGRLLEWIEEVLPSEGPHHLATGRDTNGVEIVDLSVQPDPAV
jgi:hypothetical protein